MFSVKFFFNVLFISQYVVASPPNIIIIIADDLGWNDVSFHGSNQIPTPNLDALAYSGVILNQHYSEHMCTPSRAAFLTGKYPIKNGMHGIPLDVAENYALPEGKILPDYLKDLNYKTYLVGKWHLGYNKWNSTPLYRGFDHHFGSYNGWISYYDHLTTYEEDSVSYTGHDLRIDRESAWNVVGTYITDAITDFATNVIHNHNTKEPLFLMMSHFAPHAGNNGKFLEAPQEEINKFNYIVNSNRRTYAAMVSKLDASVGKLVQSLQQKGLLKNSIIIFFSDNGAPTIGQFPNWGSNYPLKGLKGTLLEGGIRTSSFIWSPLIVRNNRVSNGLIHITDWFPTILAAAGSNLNMDPNLDGINQWLSLVNGLTSPRHEMLINIDERIKYSAIRIYNWKLISGTKSDGIYDKYFGESGENNILEVKYNTSKIYNSLAWNAIFKIINKPITDDLIKTLRRQATITCSDNKEHQSKKTFLNQKSEVYLYDLSKDPCEKENLASHFPKLVKYMMNSLNNYEKYLIPQSTNEHNFQKADPKHFNFTWSPWIY